MTAPAQGGAPALPQLEDPSAIGGVRPRIADLRNRCVIVQPTRIERNVPGVQQGTVQDRITANIFVLDGGPLEFGGKPEKYVPHTLVVPTPFLAEGVYISQTNLVAALVTSLPGPGKPQGSLVVGVIAQGRSNNPQNNPPWNLLALDANDPRRALAAQLLQRFFTGGFTNPEPQQTGAPTPPGGPLAYTHATTMPHDPATGQPIPNLQEFAQPIQQLQDQVQQDFNRMQATQPQQDPQYLAWLASQQQPAQPVASAPPAPGPLPGGFYGATDAPPAGWSPEVWATLSDAQKQQIRAATPAPTLQGQQPPF
jgi:hypothetical protein